MQTQFLNTGIDVSASLLPATASAIVLDCDGLLADTEELWLRAVDACALAAGVTLDNLDNFRGLAIDAAATSLAATLAGAGVSVSPVNELADALSARFQSLIAREATAMPGALALVGQLAKRFPIAVASNSPRVLLDQILERIGLQSLVTCSVARDEVSAAKPAPELYVAAVRELNRLDPAVTAQTAVAFEDSAVGSLAAVSAGLLVVGVNTDPTLSLSCHVRLATLLDTELVDWASDVQPERAATAEHGAFVSGLFHQKTSVLMVQCQYPAGQTARIDVYAQTECTWDELPVAPPVASAAVAAGADGVTLDLADLADGTYRFFLVTDGDLPVWNGRTGEFSVHREAETTAAVSVPVTPAQPEQSLDVLTWNLWFGGCHHNDGHAKQVAYLRQSAHTIVGLQECFGPHGARLASAAGWNIAQQGPDTAVISLYPLMLHCTETAPFATCATVVTPQGAVTVWSVHLWHSDYGPYTADDPNIPARFTLASRGERQRVAQLARIVSEQARLEREGVVSGEDPVILMGDFNVPSHLDWVPGQPGPVVDWPTSRMLDGAGFADAFRVIHPDAAAVPGHTWSPIIPKNDEPRDRIDFIFSRGAHAQQAWTVSALPAPVGPEATLSPEEYRPIDGEAGVLGEHLDNNWPTDHAAVAARLTRD